MNKGLTLIEILIAVGFVLIVVAGGVFLYLNNKKEVPINVNTSDIFEEKKMMEKSVPQIKTTGPGVQPTTELTPRPQEDRLKTLEVPYISGTNLHRYVNGEVGFAITYPDPWILIEQIDLSFPVYSLVLAEDENSGMVILPNGGLGHGLTELISRRDVIIGDLPAVESEWEWTDEKIFINISIPDWDESGQGRIELKIPENYREEALSIIDTLEIF